LSQGEESSEKGSSKLYKPTSKLLEKKATTKAASSSKPKEEEKPERPVRQVLFTSDKLHSNGSMTSLFHYIIMDFK